MKTAQAIKVITEASDLVDYALEKGFIITFKETDIYGLGIFDQNEKIITICLRTPCGKFRSFDDLLFTLAHEVRHLQHLKEDKFKDYKFYYSVDNFPEKVTNEIMNKAHEVELDCDNFARKYVIKKGYTNGQMLRRVYPKLRVSSNFLTEELKEKKKQIIINKIINKLSNKKNIFTNKKKSPKV